MADKITSEDLIDIKSFQDADKIISASLNSLATQAEALQTNYKELGSFVNKNNEQIKKSFQEQQKLAKQKDATNAEERKDIIAITKEMDKLTKAYKDNTKAQDKLQK